MFAKDGNRDFTRYFAILICALFAAVSIRWVLLYRYGGALDIDEAGYIAYSIALERAFVGGGVGGWLHAFFTPMGQAPLTMVFASWLLVVGGTHSEWIALLTNSFVFFFLLYTVYKLAKKEYTHIVGFFSVLFVASNPYIIDYSRSFNFSTSTALFFLATIYCFRQSEGMSKLYWVAATGFCAGLMVMSRTMALAFLPAFAIVFLIESLLWQTPWRRLVLSIFVGCVCFVMICGPWFAVNFKIVFEYLFTFGYGQKAAEYGKGDGIFSYENIASRLNLLDSIKIYHVILFIFGAFFVFLNLFLPRTDNKKGLSFSSHVLLLCCLCFLTLMSSRNIGSAFDLPLFPPLTIIGVGAVARVIRKSAIRTAVIVIALFGATPIYLVYADQRLCEKAEGALTSFGYGFSDIAYCGGNIQRYVVDRNGPQSEGSEIRRRGEAWRNVSAGLTEKLTALPGSERGVAFASRHMLVNVNTVNLDRIKFVGSFLPVQQIEPAVMGNSSSDYAEWLSSDPISGACYVVVLNKTQGEFASAVDPDNLREALMELKYSVAATVQTPIQDQWFEIFQRQALECAK
ncbi:ArnT family glycosyltransferase [Agrobacterium fabrum]|uniref:ArnT family glycosyltransferase n=1 Tax=Agrobacterium fabrum TaxID=1176649 RepID=UPI0024754532|nr:glycosyltransferase family 39 protein [Agrobacterium fabrum]MDH6296595.1 hypothetical protein [Agrobacterium fabrum]